jgi:lipopolysaccharide heptosyltransferase II
MSSATWQDAERILCIRLDNMGDVLMSTPAMRALACQRPGRSLTLLASPSGASTAPFVPELANTVVFNAPWLKGSGADDVLALTRSLRAMAFDAAVIFTVYSQSPLPAALLCHQAGIGLTLAHCRENPYGLLSHWVRETEPGPTVRHEARRQLDLVASVGALTADDTLSFRTLESDRQSLQAKLQTLGLERGGSGRVVVHCGASAASRRYPPEKFAQAIVQISRSHGRVLLTGSADERELVAGVAARSANGAVDLAGMLSLGELGALIENASLLISNNSGPVHIASAVGTPVVDLYALTNPQHTPWRVPHVVLNRDVPCRNCYRSICPESHHACLAGVEPAEISRAAMSLTVPNNVVERIACIPSD